MAVLRLAEPCPDVEPIPAATTPAGVGEAITLVGFGLTRLLPSLPEGVDFPEDRQQFPTGTDVTLERPAETKYRGRNRITAVCDDGSAPAFLTEGGSDDFSVATGCYGDGGGPVLRTSESGVEELVGVNSAGWCVEDFFDIAPSFIAWFPEEFPDGALDGLHRAMERYGAKFDYRLGVASSSAEIADWLHDPRVCQQGETHPCSELGQVRVCDERGMWSAACQPTGI